jgi:hypothetical protein
MLKRLPLMSLLDKPYVLRDLCAVLRPALEFAASNAAITYAR